MAQAAAGSPEALSKEGYDVAAQNYLDWVLSRPSGREQMVSKLLERLPDPSTATVLELGCGAGIPVTKLLAERCGRVLGNDISPAQISLAREHLKGLANVDLLEGSMLGLDIESSKLDAVVALHSIIHLDLDGQKLVFKKLRDWVKPGGVLLVNLSTAASSGTTMDGWLGMKTIYWSSFGQEGNEKLIRESGFEILSCDISQDAGDAEFGWFIAKAVKK